jgi:ABC-2 type transport system ATP-binding protein
MAAQIVLHNVSKIFRTSVADQSRGRLANFFRPSIKEVRAVDDIHLTVNKGERVAFIGPNGAGKSTTIKMMTGILRPSSGSIRVAGLDPQQQRRQLAFKIGTLFGQRSQLIANLPVSDSFELFGAMYELPTKTIKRRAKELSELFALDEFIDRPVRKLSLGQRMRAELAVSLLHKPEVIFLDEPTIGLDVVAKKSLRDVLDRLCKEEGVTLFLTSHDAGDIEALCDRTIIVNHGKIMIDEPTDALRQRYFTVKHLRCQLAEPVKQINLPFAHDVQKQGTDLSFSIDTTKHDVNTSIQELLSKYQIVDLDVANPTLEDIITAVYVSHR